jgi:hypothetical protein
VLATIMETSGDKDQNAYIWFGEQSPGSEPDALTWEQASQIQNANAPQTKRVADGSCYAATRRGDLREFVGVWTYRDPAENPDWSYCDYTFTITSDGTITYWSVVYTGPGEPTQKIPFRLLNVISSTKLEVEVDLGGKNNKTTIIRNGSSLSLNT